MFIKLTAEVKKRKRGYDKVLEELDIPKESDEKEYREVIINSQDILMVKDQISYSTVDLYPMEMSDREGNMGVFSKSLDVKETTNEIFEKLND